MAAALTVDNASALFPSSIGCCIAVHVENSVRPGGTQPGRVISMGTYLIRASLSPPRTWLANHKEPAELSSQHVPGIRRDRAVRLLAEWRSPNPLIMLELAKIPRYLVNN